MNCYFKITLILLAFFAVLLAYLKLFKSSFTLVDSRYQFGLLPPVNTTFGPIKKDTLPVDEDLYTVQPYTTVDYILDQDHPTGTNELIYSGGQTQLIKIPLQMNDPYNEPLRSQDILVTPYNRVKYGKC